MANAKTGIVPKEETNVDQLHQKSVAAIMSDMLDSSGIRARINELLGKRAASFTGSLVSLINADENMQKVFKEAPMTIIQAGLRAATYDLPVDPGLGYAYVVPFNNTVKKQDGTSFKRMEATFIMGYKGMYQLAMRTGVYNKLNVVDVRKGELIKFDRLTEDIEIKSVEDDTEREKLPIIGYCGFFRLVNGMEKTTYWTVEKIKAHELRFRKGKYMSKGWRENFDDMAKKTVLRNLIGKWGVMSIDYQTASTDVIQAAEAIAKGQFDDEDTRTIDVAVQSDSGRLVDPETGEVMPNASEDIENLEFSNDDMEKAMAGMDKA